ncbi:Caspase domain protein [Labrenzia sp. THAF191b]|uniref:caspase family protein n=1 Tax=unclassified Labrenzia TaxID=2648686 RepID=UPI001267E18B|nr:MULTISPECIES: caspase family protein [unclassified Labrenzia]QFS98291.1 Caspase domain protein [Labrenzia sp. THAF191b]QFT04605.1 Caspase domain protein [Labrenzia sp. THAF191a]QFT16149.1 Caspase domain protein [Labrenzia sp. THAF187b]
MRYFKLMISKGEVAVVPGGQMSRCVRLLTWFCCLFLMATGLAQADENRFALVIGNSSYEKIGRLGNPGRDADLVAKSLEAVGFEVSVHFDLDEDGLGKVLDDLADRAPDLDVAVLYFAGHGIQKDGENFLIPVDAQLKSATSIERETVSLRSFMEVMEEVPISLLFLDACRNNPFAEHLLSQSSSDGRSAGITRGLAPIRTVGDMLVTFATLPNSVAKDGAGQNSPFAKALARHVSTPDAEVSVLMKRVTRDVMAETDGEQRPQQLSQMQTEFYFKRTNAAAPETDDQQTLLAVYPGSVSAGEEVSVLADVPQQCAPDFFNITPSNRVTPIPTSYFKTVELGGGKIRYEISPGSRYGLVVEEADEKGANRIGFFCSMGPALSDQQKKEVLRRINGQLAQNEMSGTIGSDPERVAYHFAEFKIN